MDIKGRGGGEQLGLFNIVHKHAKDTARNPERARYLARLCSQSQRRILFTLPDYGASHMIK